MKRILILGLVLALLGTLIISSAAFAKGPRGDGEGNQERLGASYQNGETNQNRETNQYGEANQYGATNGAGDGSGPIQKCLDLNGDGLCGKPQ
jgi:hypothetical protein